MRRCSPLLFFLFALTASVTQAQTPRSDGDYLHRGVARFAKGDVDGAIANYNRAIQIDPHLTTVYNNRCVIKFGREDYNEALPTTTPRSSSTPPG